MMFDKLCRIYENYRSELDPHGIGDFCRDAHLFVLEKRVEDLPIDFSNYEELNHNFFLPFNDSTAIEDADGLVILRYVEGVGLADMTFAWCACFGHSKENQYVVLSGLVKTRGIISDSKSASGYSFGMNIILHLRLVADTECRVLKVSEGEKADEMSEAARLWISSLARTAIEEVIYFNSPDYFILEQISTTVKMPKDYSNTIPRSHQRPIFTMVKPKVARERMRLAQPETKGKKSPHERRAHWRVLRSEWYKNKQGERIKIPATWIGPRESVVGNKKYKIMTDF